MRQTAEVESYVSYILHVYSVHCSWCEVSFFHWFRIDCFLQMTSVERIQQYTKLEPEAAEHTDIIPDKAWPQKGAVNFQNMSLAYTPDAKNVLNNITLSIKGKEKVTQKGCLYQK